MRDRKHKYVQTVFVILVLVLATTVFLHSPGTSDVRVWTHWFNNANIYGAVEGFKANNGPYPPLASVILLFAAKSSHLVGLQPFDAIKISIVLFLFLTSFIFWIWTRDIAIVALLHLSLLLNSVSLGYLDIYFAPSLVLSMWALKERRLTLFTVLFSIAILTKWQPIIIAPFVALYILNFTPGAHWKQVDFKRLSMHMLFPVIAIAILIFSIFGVTAVLKAFIAALNPEFLSGNALNFNWLITHLLHVLYPDRFGSLIDGQATHICVPTSLMITLIPRLLFWLSYIITVVLFFKRDKSYENLILFSLLGYLVYFTFNLGVHENHLFLATILSILLWLVSKKHLLSMIIIILMSNINIFVFYGIDGMGLRFSRVIGGIIDIALLLSFFNVCFITFFWVSNVLQSRNSTAAQQGAALDGNSATLHYRR
jgi:hypothetical protein